MRRLAAALTGLLLGMPTAAASDQDRAIRLQQDVRMLAETIGDRNTSRPEAMARAADYIQEQLTAAGYTVRRQTFHTDGVEVANLIAEHPGTTRASEHVLVGAHYDSCFNPGADDNASGVAGLLELARALHGTRHARSIRFIAFVNEEPPHFRTPQMGSAVYVDATARADRPSAVVILEAIGYYAERPGSQRYPPIFGWGRPTAGNFIGVVGNLRSMRMAWRTARGLRRHGPVPVEWVAAPESVDGVAWSDQWAFWRAGIPAVMVTDTAYLRNPHYHEATDTPDTLDYPRMAQVVTALVGAVGELAGTP
jgi:hypothetical protein